MVEPLLLARFRERENGVSVAGLSRRHKEESAAVLMAYRAFSRLVVQTGHRFGRRGLHFPLAGPPSSFTAAGFAPFSTHHGRWRSKNEDSAGGGSPSRPRAVIFDVGGVVVPSPFPVFSSFERERGLPAGSVVHTIKETGGAGAWARLERGELSVGEFGRPFSEEYKSATGRDVPAEVFTELLESFRVGRQVTVRPIMLEAIERLHRHGVKTGLLTNNFRYDDGGTLFPQDNLKVDVVSFPLSL